MVRLMQKAIWSLGRRSIEMTWRDVTNGRGCPSNLRGNSVVIGTLLRNGTTQNSSPESNMNNLTVFFFSEKHQK